MAFGERRVFDRLSFRFPPGRISVILGGSGSGKSTVLRLIGGLVRPVSGRILVDGEDVTQLTERQLFRVRERLGMMFQGGALLDSLTVFDNVAFALRERTRASAAEIATRVRDSLAAVGLTDAETLLPGQLSGGMVKRAALARALIMRPRILLCDEPFSGLDPVSARRIEVLLGSINARFGMTVVVVSHDIPSTMRMAAQVLVLLPGGAVQGSPDELERSPDPRIAAFLHPDVEAALRAEAGEVEVAPGARAC
jgi:phospholipid/cholesterol/gamma-HCH transport system ATP-binding protein